MLTEKQCPWTGPYGLPESGLKSKGPTAKALKRGMGRLGFLAWSENYDEHFNQPLSQALSNWDPGHTGYGKGRWEKIRAARIPAGKPHAGEYALDGVAQDLIQGEWLEAHPPAPPMPSLVYPHEKGWASYTAGYIHQTGGISGNYALDFMAAPGTPVLAPENGTVSRTSGYDPGSGLHGSNQDVFGWSIYLRCRTGFFYSTHYGIITVQAGSICKVGDIIGYVGHWPHDTGRSHTHLGFTSFSHIPWFSISKIKAVAAAPRVDGHPRVPAV